jgi:phosphopantothenoylcysteine decarboxylase/phosphopantothenate--cysteine ligase
MSLKNKRILITAGPTWVPIDTVRVISNIATGQTGILLAEKLQRLGAKVTLLLGPVENCCLNKKIKLMHFRFFDELKFIITKELTSQEYDIVIQTAAVSDYRPLKSYPRKIKSDKKVLNLTLLPTIKIINLIKRIDASLFLVGFKFEPQVHKEELIQKAKLLIRRAHLDLAVANTMSKNQYKAYILSENKIYGPLGNREELTEKLSQRLESSEKV